MTDTHVLGGMHSINTAYVHKGFPHSPVCLHLFLKITLQPQRGKTAQPFRDNNVVEHKSQLRAEIKVSIVDVVTP